ncbi:twin-arginine translocation pathway signal [Actinomycetospora corticicola]|uniref:Carboxypeptidase family protein n=1 Tax=Actinomycetospora corticicola TaxID=663602 RepID=A0A7Y9J4Q9_9PSEU|nr:twin-arginine translocation pathway signal [Actinomycetospora corticicola]NYD35181.1 hypothetical protein [Actinomycetospora corticicola]
MRPHPAAITVFVAVVWVVGVLLATSSLHGTGARDVGVRASGPEGPSVAELAAGTCAPTVTNPGGTNNYVPKAPWANPLGSGFTVTGTVRDEACRPVPGVRIQVWAQTATASEQRNRTSVRTDDQGRYRVDTDPLVAQFGEPNVHVGYDDPGPWRRVFLRNVTRDGDTGAQVDLVLSP